jgi:predicted small metal-binding protein
MTTRGTTMRAIDCPCGHHFEADDDEELFRLCRDHVAGAHPEMQRTDEQIRERIVADAYDVVTA